MIGWEVNYINPAYNTYWIVDQDGPLFFGDNKIMELYNGDWRDFISEGGHLEFCKNEYWGNNDDGYDFNDCFSRKIIRNLRDLDDFFASMF